MVNWMRGKIRSSSAPIWLAIGLLAIATVMVLPNYVTGEWPWSQAPTLPAVKELKTLRQQGISLVGWQEMEQQTIELGQKKWSIQALTPALEDMAMPISPAAVMDAIANTYGVTDLPTDMADRLQTDPVFLLLRPQSNAKDEPLVEWIDLNGLQRWKTDQVKSVRLPMKPDSVAKPGNGAKTENSTKVLTRYFRGWNQDHTYAVMQWYAWPTGGSPKISDWFWADQRMQWRKHQRMPWIGVTLMVPMKPLGDIAPSQPLVEAIAQSIQSQLVQALSTAIDISR